MRDLERHAEQTHATNPVEDDLRNSNTENEGTF